MGSFAKDQKFHFSFINDHETKCMTLTAIICTDGRPNSSTALYMSTQLFTVHRDGVYTHMRRMLAGATMSKGQLSL